MCEEPHLSEEIDHVSAYVLGKERVCLIKSEVWASNKSPFAVLTVRQETLHIKRTGSHT